MRIIIELTTLDDPRYLVPELKRPVSEKKIPMPSRVDPQFGLLEQEIVLPLDLEKEGEMIVEEEDPSALETSTSPGAPIRVNYSFHHDKLLAEQLNGAVSVDYTALWYGADAKEKAAFKLKDEYWVTSVPANDTEVEMLSTEEAQATFVDIQYSTIIGAASEVSSTERRKFDLWIKFNRSFFNLFESMYAVTREVDYRPLA